MRTSFLAWSLIVTATLASPRASEAAPQSTAERPPLTRGEIDPDRLDAEEAGYWGVYGSEAVAITDAGLYAAKAKILWNRLEAASEPADALAKQQFVLAREKANEVALDMLRQLRSVAASNPKLLPGREPLTEMVVPNEFAEHHKAVLELVEAAGRITDRDKIDSPNAKRTYEKVLDLDEAQSGLAARVRRRTVKKQPVSWTVTYSMPSLGKIDLLGFDIKPKFSIPGTGLSIEPKAIPGIERLIIREQRRGSSVRVRHFELKGRSVEVDLPKNDGVKIETHGNEIHITVLNPAD